MESIMAKPTKLKKNQPKVVPQQALNPSKTIPPAYALMQAHSGPIPSPQVLKGYEEICPGAAAEIVGMAHKQMDHRMSIENYKLEKESSLMEKGQLFAFIVAIAGIVAAVWLGLKGAQWTGSILGGGSLGVIVLGFLGKDTENKKGK